MPCNDGIDIRWAERVIPQLTKMLCALSGALEKQSLLDKLLDSIDWHEVGVARADYENWWAEHKEADAKRRTREAREQQSAELAAKARARLTPEELRALGLN